MISPLLRRYTWNSAWLYNVRIFIALCGTTLFPWWIGEVKLTIPPHPRRRGCGSDRP
ncbi:hypothetical protein LNN85_20035 [Klebsiella pneumoniae subsp. pneumoniae]|nr:hypothetical protein [Klebsiella pneumoniae subsp. pneumoniae]